MIGVHGITVPVPGFSSEILKERYMISGRL
jgi:hypothetical protein